MKDILKERTSETEDYNSKLAELTNFIDYYIAEAGIIIDNWENK